MKIILSAVFLCSIFLSGYISSTNEVVLGRGVYACWRCGKALIDCKCKGG